MCAQFRGGSRGGGGDEEDRSITNEEPIIPSVDEHGLKETTLKDSYRITLVPSSDGISDTLTVIQSFSYSLLPVLSATYTSMIQQDASNCTLITTRTVHRSLD
ncbi:hypothetical protein FOB22_006639 [Saccharomyces cerevisiae]|nr:hypothetical protein FOB22_006639 [Saccharomyces cerevisiae]